MTRQKATSVADNRSKRTGSCAHCGEPVPALTMSCSRECALAYWRAKKERDGTIGEVIR